MGNLYGHQGRVSEFIIGLCGLLILLSLHRPFRREAAAFIGRAGDFVRATAPIPHHWKQAFGILRSRRRVFGLLVIGLIIFDYLYNAFYSTMWSSEYLGLASATTQPDPGLIALFSVSMSLLYYSGAGLFGWIAWRLGQSKTLDEATKFSPLLLFLAVAAMLAAADYAASYLNLRSFLYARRPEILLEIIIWPAFTFSLYMAIGGALVAAGRIQSYGALAIGFLGFFVWCRCVDLLHEPAFSRRTDMRDFSSQALEAVSNLTHASLWYIGFVALAVALAVSAQPKRS